jgi:hypothetical protein
MLISELKNDKGLYNGKLFEVKPFVSFIDKKILCDQIIDNCLFIDENNMVRCDFFMKYLLTNMKIVVLFTDLEFEEEYLQEYDFLNENKLIDYILSQIDDCELNFINEMINKEIEQKMQIGNSIESIIASRLDKLIDKLPTDKQLKSLSKSLVKDLNKLDWNQLPLLKEMWETATFKQGDKIDK